MNRLFHLALTQFQILLVRSPGQIMVLRRNRSGRPSCLSDGIERTCARRGPGMGVIQDPSDPVKGYVGRIDQARWFLVIGEIPFHQAFNPKPSASPGRVAPASIGVECSNCEPIANGRTSVPPHLTKPVQVPTMLAAFDIAIAPIFWHNPCSGRAGAPRCCKLHCYGIVRNSHSWFHAN